MDEWLKQLLLGANWAVLCCVIAASLYVLGKAANRLVTEAVVLSESSGVPKMVIAATVVSLGTTTPEAAVSVLAAIGGSPGLSLGNAVGSIICDTGLILGFACIIAPLELDRTIVNRQGWIQLGAASALVLLSFPWNRPASVFANGGRLPQAAGMLFMVALGVYLYQSIRWASGGISRPEKAATVPPADGRRPTVVLVLLRLALALAFVVLSAQVLIPAVTVAAKRLQVPEGIIAATLVAFGTSLPELVTAVAAARKGHGEIAVGNVIGADILNVLFVAGASAAVTRGGLAADGHFFRVLFPVMLLVLVVFRIGIVFSRDRMRRGFGVILLATYGIYLLVSYSVHAQ
jgi:cation:H+ antiporter